MSEAPPRLSVITVVGGAPGPEARAIASLAPARQAELLPGDAELVVVERASPR
ncbi:MAG: hypothetical protein FJ104_07255, partial [Deltaproteobacteria bacterium]|nr:hypothetical protein [Deltaproteobacteria bacterium]